jgi:polyprenyl P-hydroxybenzoate/phenylacrylic acid decarboxylase-like protein
VKLVVGITGASGAIYGVRLLEVLSVHEDVETHLVISGGAAATIRYETGRDPDDLHRLATKSYAPNDLAAALASGTFLTDGMVIAPCSMGTLSRVATSANDNLIGRAADVHLKERRRLVLLVRETPLHAGHLRLMLDVTNAGAIVLPPVPGFYIRPKTIEELVDHTIGKTLDLLGLTDHGLYERWNGPAAGTGERPGGSGDPPT